MSDDNEFPESSDFLRDARRDFRQFYVTATPQDAGLMDGLVMTHAALVVGMNTIREGLDRETLAELEQACIAAEQKFSELREKVRACPTFNELIAAERAQIERMAFDVKPPIGG
jgi:hypothetical protein